MNIQPTLESELLIVRPLQQSDFDELFKAAADPLIWELHPQPDRYKPEVFQKFFEESMKSGGALAIVDRKTNQVIGSSRYYDFSEEKSSVIIGYTFLSRNYWGGHFNRDLKKLMVNYALRFVKATRFQVALGNFRSQRAMEKLGAEKIGIEEVPIFYGPPKKSFIYHIENPFY